VPPVESLPGSLEASNAPAPEERSQRAQRMAKAEEELTVGDGALDPSCKRAGRLLEELHEINGGS
jgi:hypothetical protein